MTDSGSGLRTDRRGSRQWDRASTGEDMRRGRLNEPLSHAEADFKRRASTGHHDDGGDSRGRCTGMPDIVQNQETERRPELGRRVEEDRSYSTSFTILRRIRVWPSMSGRSTATDRVGNTAMSDAKTSTPDKAETSTLSRSTMMSLRRQSSSIRRHRFRSRSKATTAERCRTHLRFSSVFGNDTDTGGTGDDPLDSSTIGPSDDFVVVG